MHQPALREAPHTSTTAHGHACTNAQVHRRIAGKWVSRLAGLRVASLTHASARRFRPPHVRAIRRVQKGRQPASAVDHSFHTLPTRRGRCVRRHIILRVEVPLREGRFGGVGEQCLPLGAVEQALQRNARHARPPLQLVLPAATQTRQPKLGHTHPAACSWGQGGGGSSDGGATVCQQFAWHRQPKQRCDAIIAQLTAQAKAQS